MYLEENAMKRFKISWNQPLLNFQWNSSLIHLHVIISELSSNKNHQTSRGIHNPDMTRTPGWQSWSNMTIMLRYGMIMVIHIRHGMMTARSWHGIHIFFKPATGIRTIKLFSILADFVETQSYWFISKRNWSLSSLWNIIYLPISTESY